MRTFTPSLASGLSRYTLEPWLNNGELDWRKGDGAA